MKKFLDTLAVIMLILSSAAVTLGVSIYLMRLPPIALKSDITTVQNTAVEALKQTHIEQKTQDKASAAVSAVVDTHGKKLQSADDRIKKDEEDIALLKKRVGILDGSDLSGAPAAVKHAPRH